MGEAACWAYRLVLARRNEFLVIEQKNSVDSEEQAVYDSDEKARLKGCAGTPAKVGGVDSVVLRLDHVQWSKASLRHALSTHLSKAAG
jgi:hypothetical protein